MRRPTIPTAGTVVIYPSQLHDCPNADGVMGLSRQSALCGQALAFRAQLRVDALTSPETGSAAFGHIALHFMNRPLSEIACGRFSGSRQRDVWNSGIGHLVA